MDNVEEAVSGVKGSIVAKIYGDSLPYMEQQCAQIAAILKQIDGITDVGAIKNIGQPQLQIELDQTKMAIYGITTAEANAVIETAIGGKAATELYQGIRKFDIRIRFPQSYRNDLNMISNVLVPSMSGVQIPLHEIATLKTTIGPTLIFRDDHERYAAVKFSVRGRDMGSAINEARRQVSKQIHLNKDYSLIWQGDFENQQRAQHRLAQVVPISLLLIFLLLFVMFGNFKDAGLVFLNVPFALVGGILMLLLTGTNFSISAGIGFIALFGICILEGVLLISAFKDNLEHKESGIRLPLSQAIHKGVSVLCRPVLMTALMAIIGLLPAAMATGIGSESARPLARVVIGGLICATIFSLLVFPVIFNNVYAHIDKKKRRLK
nr:efflux RND transporter permease subunit [Arachidicoccus ginsenosidivorans]